MRILVNGQEAALKKDISFQYVSENPLFTEAEDYTMEMTFPLDDSPQNILIFGALHVKGVDIGTISYPCEIITDLFDKTGIITITSVSDTEVKGQFLEGISQQNYIEDPTLQNYINEIDYSRIDGQNRLDEYSNFGAAVGWENYPVYNKSTETIEYSEQLAPGSWTWYSYRIYLKHLVEVVAQAIGYSVDQTVLLNIVMYQSIVVANCRSLGERFTREDFNWLPLNAILPKWTVKEFFQNVADFFGCTVFYDSINKHIAFTGNKNIVDNSGIVNLQVLDDFTVNMSDVKTPSYKGNKSFKLPDACNPNNINSCPWILNDRRVPVARVSLSNLLEDIRCCADPPVEGQELARPENYAVMPQYLFYIYNLAGGQYCVISNVQEEFIDGGTPEEGTHGDYIYYQLEVVNQFGGTGDGEELKLCPAPMKSISTDRRHVKLLPCIDVPEDPLSVAPEEVTDGYPKALDFLSGGERDTSDLYYDKLWLFCVVEGSNHNKYAFTRRIEPYDVFSQMLDEGLNPMYNDDEETDPKGGYYTQSFDTYPWSLTPNDSGIVNIRKLPKVDETKLYKYKFFSKELPNPKAIFVIRGKQYACLRITAHFSVDGMSDLLEGEFYEITG